MKRNTFIPVLAVIISFFLVFSCSKEKSTDNTDLTYNYFPVKVGSTWIYDVDSFAYDDNTGTTTIDTFYYQYKERIVAEFQDVSGNTGQAIERFFRQNDTDAWHPAKIWTVMKTPVDVQKVEENIRYVKLLFPLRKGREWNGNSYNNLGEQGYSVTSFDEPAVLNGMNYSQTVNVLHMDEENAIEEIRSYEIYARDIGMIYSLSDSINTQVSGSRGYRHRLTLKSFTP